VKLKLDENLGNDARTALEAAGHDVSTVPLQHLQAALDDELIAQCKREARALVTLDLDFANPLQYRPVKYAGIAVLRLPGKPTSQVLNELVRTLVGALQQETLTGRLWIVEVGRIRIHQSDQ
jgi:predicted nuclease of predicted toxin-antitoxin system